MRIDDPDPHDLSNTVVGLVPPDKVGNVLQALSASGFPAEALQGEEGKEHFDSRSGPGFLGSLRKAISGLGDQSVALETLEKGLGRGEVVIVVDVDPDLAPDAGAILVEHEAAEVWRLGEWTSNPIGEG